MRAFRFLALAYALSVFLIAPAWLSAVEEPPAPPPSAEEPAAGDEPVATVPEVPAPAPETDPAPQDPVSTTPEPRAEPEPATEPELTAEPAKKEKAEQPEKAEEPNAKAAASASVTVSDFKFAPATVTVNEGDTVTFTNQGPTVHTATADDGSFDTGIIDKGASKSATFTSAGTVTYFCEPHPFMKGKVVVQAVSAGSGSGAGSSDTTDDSGSAVAGEETTTTDDSSGLPNTGAETLLIALLGAATLAAGMFLRRRSES